MEQNSTKERVEQINSGISAMRNRIGKGPIQCGYKTAVGRGKAAKRRCGKSTTRSNYRSYETKSGGTGVGREDGPGKPVPAPEILATSVADAFAKLGDPADASKVVLGKILADKAGPVRTSQCTPLVVWLALQTMSLPMH
jgi:hypothetical protein